MARVKFFKSEHVKMPDAPVNMYYSMWFPHKGKPEAYINMEHLDHTISLSKRDADELLRALTLAVDGFDAELEARRIEDAKYAAEYAARKAKKEVTV